MTDPTSENDPDQPTEAPEPAAGEVQLGQGVPAVVAVVATRDPGPWLETCLESLAGQGYPGLSILVVDAGSTEELADRVGAVAPGAFIRRVPEATTFARAANETLGTVEGAVFLLFCHDDVALGSDAVQAMVNDAFRTNAGIVGAKLVDWDQADRLRSVGARVDRFGATAEIAEPGELDQSQHDGVADVASVSSATMLVRADLFADLGGFSTIVDPVGIELDLCWRANVAGARTVVAGQAIVRHRELSAFADPSRGVRRTALRSQTATLLTCESGGRLALILPLAAMLSIVDLVANLVALRLRRAGEILDAWGWNLVHLPRTFAARRRAQALSRGDRLDRDSIQMRGSARFNSYLRGLRSAGGQQLPAALAAARGLPADWSIGSGPIAPVVAVLVLLIVLIGSRGLITGGVVTVREMVPLGDAAALGRGWWDTWRPAGLGHASASPLLHPALSVLSALTLGSDGFVLLLLVLVPLLVGPLGVWRQLRRGLTGRAAGVATLVYAAAAAPHDAIAEGRLGALTVYAVLPWSLGRMLAASEVEPFGPRVRRSSIRHGVQLGLLIAGGAAISPGVAPVVLVSGLLVAVGLLVSGPAAAARRVAVATFVGMGVASVALIPSLLVLLRASDRWAELLGFVERGQEIKWSDLLAASTGITAGGWALLGTFVAALLPLVIGRGWRARWAVVAWISIAGWWALAAWAQWAVGTLVPPAAMLAVPAVLGATWAVGVGVDSFTIDVAPGRFGWRQLVSIAAAVGAVLAAAPVLVAAADGRWQQPVGDPSAALSTLDSAGLPTFRTLWIGVSDDLPMSPLATTGGVAIGLTDGSMPTVDDRVPVELGRGERALVRTWERILDDRTRRGAAELAEFSISNIVVIESPPGRRDSVDVARVREVLLDQLDLREVAVSPGLAVFTSELAEPIRGQAGARAGPREPVLSQGRAPTTFSGRLRPTDLVVGFQGRAWELRVDGQVVAPSGTGWAQTYSPTGGGAARFTQVGSVADHFVLLLQLLAWVMFVVVASGRTPVPPRSGGNVESPADDDDAVASAP